MMRAKMRVGSVLHDRDNNQDLLELHAVCSSGYDGDGLNEDNTYARYSPYAHFKLTVANPALIGQFKRGQTFYVDFTPVEAPSA